MDKVKLWPDLMGHFDVEHGESIYGSEWALEQIYQNQNPPDCRKAKYLISGGWPYGFGSRIHMEGMILGIAMQLGRVYLHHPDGDNIFWETKIPFCQQQNDETLTCFYEQFSKCTIDDALADASDNVNNLRTYFGGSFKAAFESEVGRQQLIKQLAREKSINIVLTYGGGPYDRKQYVPSIFQFILDCSPMRKEFYHYWWRAVSATYIARPQARTLKLLDEIHDQHLNYRSCIAMFVRHGDKGIEMKLIDFQKYREACEYMWRRGLLPGSPYVMSSGKRSMVNLPSGFDSRAVNGTIFITTEDPSVLQEAEVFGATNHWRISYTKLFDRLNQTAFKTWDEQHKKGHVAVHDNYEYISMLLNLNYALQCEAWVCTLASNSCRIIDELRATIGGKANRHYADLSMETCEDPPCVDGHGSLKSVDD
eukprot:gene2885-3150_t